MSNTESPGDEHEAIEAAFSDYYDRSLPEEDRARVEQHLAECEACQRAYRDFEETVGALSGLHKMAAPHQFEKSVEERIHRRSGGRFFGRKAFGDRVPFELLAVIALIIGLAVFFLIRSSGTGSLRYDHAPDKPQIAPGAKEALPQP